MAARVTPRGSCQGTLVAGVAGEARGVALARPRGCGETARKSSPPGSATVADESVPTAVGVARALAEPGVAGVLAEGRGRLTESPSDRSRLGVARCSSGGGRGRFPIEFRNGGLLRGGRLCPRCTQACAAGGVERVAALVVRALQVGDQRASRWMCEAAGRRAELRPGALCATERAVQAVSRAALAEAAAPPGPRSGEPIRQQRSRHT
jgi:hypothetical protein